jgi:hypothetical protein
MNLEAADVLSAYLHQAALTVPESVSTGDSEALLEFPEGDGSSSPNENPLPRRYLRIRTQVAADSDGDRLNDWEESLFGSDPYLYDSDADSISDFEEYSSGLNPTFADAHLDYDGDGFTNLEEIAGGSDPLVRRTCT